jgi:hypothetical protein
MAALPPPRSQTVEAIYSWWAGKLRRPSRRLGASQIGEECERRLWYSFRWCMPPGSEPDGRMMRLFNRGHREEAVFVDELRGIGCDVRDIDPSTGEQFTFTAVSGHFVAKIDGVALKVPDAPKTWHNLSFKTSASKYWGPLAKNGVLKEQPKNWAQNQVEMQLSQLDRTLFLSVNKDTDEIYAERIRYDEAEARRLIEKAERIIFAAEPLPRLSDDAAFWKCKGCPASPVCHGTQLPPVSCRTCLHATPEREGDGRWSCARWKADIPHDAQQAGCDKHLFVPALLARWGEAVDASEAEGWVEYRAPDGLMFRNGAWGQDSYTSRELAGCSGPGVLRDSAFLELRAKYQGRVVGYEEAA